MKIVGVLAVLCLAMSPMPGWCAEELADAPGPGVVVDALFLKVGIPDGSRSGLAIGRGGPGRWRARRTRCASRRGSR